MSAWSDEELIGILGDWHRYAHGGNMIGACNNEKCQAALAEIKARISRRQELNGKELGELAKKWATELRPEYSYPHRVLIVRKIFEEYDFLVGQRRRE